MNALRVLAWLNLATAILCVCLALVLWVTLPLTPGLTAFTLVIVAMAGPNAWLGVALENGRGRTLQTILAIVSLFNVPVGTAFGIFALWVVWSSDHARRFEEAEAGLAGSERDDYQAEAEDAYGFAWRMAADGLTAGQVERMLVQRGLDDAEIDRVLRSVEFRRPTRRSTNGTPRAPQTKRTDVPSTRARPARPTKPDSDATPPRPPRAIRRAR